MLKAEIDTDLMAEFLGAPLGTVMKLPVTMLTPMMDDDSTSSHSGGAIEVYHLHRVEDDGSITTQLWIADGNHRYFDLIREARIRSETEGSVFVLRELLIPVRKIIPDPENDIRLIWGAHHWFQ
jgi:hypothetical protein